MLTWSVAVWPALICFTVAIVSPLIWVPALRRWGVIDVPNARSSHAVPTIRGAGLAPAGGVLAAGVVALAVLPEAQSLRLVTVLVLAVAAAGLGLAEDVRGISVGRRLALQLFLGGFFALLVAVLTSQPVVLALPLAVAVAGYVNVANFMDGVDAMSAQHGLLAGGYYLILGLHGFGALDLGGRSRHRRGLPGLRALEPVARTRLPGRRRELSARRAGGRDARCGRARRPAAARGDRPGAAVPGRHRLDPARSDPAPGDDPEAHRGHVYQRLTDRGWSHVGSAGTVAVAHVICGAAGLWSQSGGWSIVGALCLIVVVLSAYLTTPRWATRVPVRSSDDLGVVGASGFIGAGSARS